MVTEGQDHLLGRYVTNNLRAPIPQDPDQEVLYRGVRSFNLQYSDGTNWYDTWDSTQALETIPVNMLPAMVWITLELEPATSGGAPGHYERIIPLPCSTLVTAIANASKATGGGG